MKFITASNITVKTKVKFAVIIAHSPKVDCVPISGNERSSNKKNDCFALPHYCMSLKDARVQHSRGCTRAGLPFMKGSIAVLLAMAIRAPFKTNNCGRAEFFIIKSLKHL